MSVRLGLDASQPIASCAVAAEEGIAAYGEAEKPIENFPALIRSVASQANICLGDVDEIVVCIGPGSQMGIRAAVVTANALALALKKPVSGVMSTDAAAVLSELPESEAPCKVAVSAGRRRWFVGGYRRQDGVLERLGALELVDDLPEDAYTGFGGAKDGGCGRRSCACGVLLAAEQQRQLISQAMLDEVRPYEETV